MRASLAAFTALCMALVAVQGQAQNWADGAADIPRFEACLPEQMRAFAAAISGPAYGADRGLGDINVHWVQHCGYLAIGICDVSERTFYCQARLREAWGARAAELRADLPDPATVDGLALSPLYTRLYALAEGRDAGDPCAGWDYRRQVWCSAFEAALVLENAVYAWQAARLMGVIGPMDWDAFADVGAVEER